MNNTLVMNEMLISKVGGLLADSARSAILVALCEGEALPAGELAERAGISASTASTHLTKLMEARWVSVERYGRQRYYRLASPQVARLLDQIMSVAPRSLLEAEAGRTRHDYNSLHLARTCYDHLAGKLGVALSDALLQQGVLEVAEHDYTLTDSGKSMLDNLGVDVTAAIKQRRAFARRCLDWTERRDHLGGALGAAICTNWLEQGWIQRHLEGREIQVTVLGAYELKSWGIVWPPFIV